MEEWFPLRRCNRAQLIVLALSLNPNASIVCGVSFLTLHKLRSLVVLVLLVFWLLVQSSLILFLVSSRSFFHLSGFFFLLGMQGGCEKFGMHTINRDTIVRYNNKHANN